MAENQPDPLVVSDDVVDVDPVCPAPAPTPVPDPVPDPLPVAGVVGVLGVEVVVPGLCGGFCDVDAPALGTGCYGGGPGS